MEQAYRKQTTKKTISKSKRTMIQDLIRNFDTKKNQFNIPQKLQ